MLGDVAVAVNPTRRALHAPHRQARCKLPLTRPRDPHPRRRVGQARVRHRRRQGHARARPQRLRHRPAPQPARRSRSWTRPRTSSAEAGPAYAGLDRYDARRKVLADLEAAGPARTGHATTSTPSASAPRCQTVVEPRLSTQWFLAVNKAPNSGRLSLAEAAPPGQSHDRRPFASRPSSTRRSTWSG